MPQLGPLDFTLMDVNSVLVAGATVNVYREGATINGDQAGTAPLTLTIRHPGKISTGDTVFLENDNTISYVVTAQTLTTMQLSGFTGTLAVLDGQRIVPSNSQPTVYSDDQGGASVAQPLTSDAFGSIVTSGGVGPLWMEGGAYHILGAGAGAVARLYEVVVIAGEPPAVVYSGERDGATAVAHVEDTRFALTVPGAKLKSGRNLGTEKYFFDYAGRLSNADRKNIAAYATGGIGTQGSPWTGWESAVVEGAQNYFPPGYYRTDGLALGITATNVACKTSLIGDGSGSTFITIATGSGQFRVYGSGGGTRVLQSLRVEGFCVVAGINNTSAGLFSVENLDVGCYVGDILVDPTAAFSVTTAIQVLNSENCNFGMLSARGQSAVSGAAGNIGTGLKVTTNDGIQRGNIFFAQTHLVNCTTTLSVSSSGGSLDNLVFGVFKAVNSSLVDGTTAISLASNAEQITFLDLHMEVFNNGMNASGVENVTVLNGLASNIHNVANNAGAAYTLNNGDGARIFSRIDTVYNGFVLTGTMTRALIQQGAVGTVSGTFYSDTSSGVNVLFNGGTTTGPFIFNSRVLCNAAFGFGASGTPLTVSSNVITATKNTHSIDNSGGAVTVKTINGLNDGDILFLRPNTDGNNVVFDETGNLKLNGTTFTLGQSRDTAVFWKVGSAWLEVTHSVNG